LLVAGSVVFISGGIGLVIGMLAGYLGNRLDAILMRVTDAALAFPFLILAIVIAGLFGSSTKNVVIVLGLAGWASYARVIRSEVLRVRHQDFVTMAKILGGSPAWVMLQHILPNIASSFLVLATLQIGHAIVAEGSLSFLGIGVPPPAPSWGSMLAEGRNYMAVAWWIPDFPAIAISSTVLAANLMGDWLRYLSDPTRRQ